MKKTFSRIILPICLAATVAFTGTAFASPAEDAVKQAAFALQKGNVTEGMAQINKAIKLEPQNSMLYIQRGEISIISKKIPQATADFKKALEIASDKATANSQIAFVYALYNQNELALQHIENAIALAPNNADNFHMRAKIKFALQDATAGDDLNQAITLNPNLSAAYFDRAILALNAANYPAAEKDFKKILSLEQNKAAANLIIGNAYARSKEPTRALPYLTQSIAASPSPQAYLTRSSVYMLNKDLKKATQDADSAVQLAPDATETYFYRANLNLRANAPDKAIVDLNKVLEMAPDAAAAYLVRGLSYHALSNKEAATADFKKAVSLNANLAQSVPAEYK